MNPIAPLAALSYLCLAEVHDAVGLAVFADNGLIRRPIGVSVLNIGHDAGAIFRRCDLIQLVMSKSRTTSSGDILFIAGRQGKSVASPVFAAAAPVAPGYSYLDVGLNRNIIGRRFPDVLESKVPTGGSESGPIICPIVQYPERRLVQLPDIWPFISAELRGSLLKLSFSVDSSPNNGVLGCPIRHIELPRTIAVSPERCRPGVQHGEVEDTVPGEGYRESPYNKPNSKPLSEGLLTLVSVLAILASLELVRQGVYRHNVFLVLLAIPCLLVVVFLTLWAVGAAPGLPSAT